MPSRRQGHVCSPRDPNVFFGGDAAFGRRTSSGRSRTAMTPPSRSIKLCRGEDRQRAPGAGGQRLSARKWASTSGAMTTTSPTMSAKGSAARQGNRACKNIKIEVELGFDPKLALAEAQRCLNCDVQTVFAELVHRVRCLRRHLPDGLHHLHARTARSRICGRG